MDMGCFYAEYSMQNTAVTNIHQGLWIEAYWIRCVVGEPGMYATTACSMVALEASDENHSSLWCYPKGRC